MAAEEIILPPSSTEGQLGVKHLKRFLAKSLAKRNGQLGPESYLEEWNLDKSMLDMLGLGLEQTIGFVYTEAPTEKTFEQWVLEVNGGKLDTAKIAFFNNIVEQSIAPQYDTEETDKVLTDDDLAFWDANGYVIVRNAVDKDDCEAAIQAIEAFLDVDVKDAGTWYKSHPNKLGIMVQFFQHPALDKNRKAYRIQRAYEQIWGRKDLIVSTDRVGFNPPETEGYKYQGVGLHWDVSLHLPIPFGTQGILYLSDTQAHQGALTLVPGFQHRIETWLSSLPKGTNPRIQNLHALGAIPIAANGGDFIIWHQALPHGASPNRASVPRIVQYINYQPALFEAQEMWV